MDLRKNYNRIASEWHKTHKHDDWWIVGTDAFASFLQSGDLVLDVGCAGGVKSHYLMDNDLRVVGIDFSDRMIEIAKREVPKGEFHVLDMRKVDTLDTLFDGIFMQASLLHIPRNEAGSVIRSMSGVLNKGGYLYVAVKDKKPGRGDEEIKLENDYEKPCEIFFGYFTTDEIRTHLEQAGLYVVFEHTVPSGNARWIQMIGKKV